MAAKFKKLIIFQALSVGGAPFLNKNLRKVDFGALTAEDRAFVQRCLAQERVSPYSSRLLGTEIGQGYAQVFYREFHARRRKAARFEFSSRSNFSYRFANKQKGCFRGCVSRSFRLLYNVAKLAVLLLIALLTYLLIALSKIKWPEAKGKDQSKCDDDPAAPGCCSCEEVKEKSESMKDRLQTAVRDSEARASRASQAHREQLAGIGALLAAPFAQAARAQEEEKLLDSVEANLKNLSKNIHMLEKTHMFGCDCQKLYRLYNDFENEVNWNLILAFGKTVNTRGRLVDKVQKYSKYLQSSKKCEESFGEHLTEYTGNVAEAIFSDLSRLIN